MGYLYLAVAIVSEVIGTLALQASDGFSKTIPSVIVIIGYSAAFYFLSLVLKTIPVGIAYAIWAGLGIVLIAFFGAIVFKQIPDLAAIAGMSLIVLGVIVIKVFSKSVPH